MDALTLKDVNELTAYWTINPPVHLLVKGFVGYDNNKAENKKQPDEYELQGLVNAFKGK